MIPDWLAGANEVVSIHRRAPVSGVHGAWPEWLPGSTVDRLAESGIAAPWVHQTQLADLAFAGRHAAITTPTASGKSLAFLLPLLAARHGVVGTQPDNTRGLRSTPRHTALYLAPTKALAHDQLRVALQLGEPGWRISTLDGDSEAAERRFARESADYVFTNPDMLHFSVLPSHARWSSFLGALRYIIVDEAHRYRGTFGAHVALVLRRLRRLCARYGASPTVLFASATSPNAAGFCGKLIGEPAVDVVSESGAPRPGLDVVCWRPSTTATADAARLLGRLVADDVQTIAFVASRNLAELIAVRARKASGAAVASYRSGYLAADRRALEAQLRSRELLGVAATNALELGVDVSGMDAVISHGFPGTSSAMWQQFGRAGRSGRDALAVLIARDDPLDSYVIDHPDMLFGEVEPQAVYPENPWVLGPHLAAAAQEVPLRTEDERWFGPGMTALADRLAARGILRRRPAGWYWTRPERAVDYINLRSTSGHGIDVIEQSSGRVLGTVDEGTPADRTLHEGAVYLHQGEQFLVSSYDPEQRSALVVGERLGYYTQPVGSLQVAICTTQQHRPLGVGTLHFGEVSLTSQVMGFLRRDEETHEVWDQTPLDLPQHTFRTQSVWWTMPDSLLAAVGVDTVRAGSAAHAMEHCAIGLLPVFAPCDRWDIGGVSFALHPETSETTVFVHDGMPGGAGFAQQGFERADEWLAATLERLTNCRCEAGCPSCVVSPKCGNANQHLDRFAARDLLAGLLNAPPA